MLRIKFCKTYHLFFLTFLFISFQNNSFAQIGGDSEIIREVEKNLLFDKETQEKFDVYNAEYGANKLDKPSIGTIKNDDQNQKEYTQDEMNIVLIDKVKIDKDLREKEKLAYNSVLIGQYENALQLYKEILAKEPKNNYIKYSMAVVYQKLLQFKQAKNIYQELLKVGADNRDEVINNIMSIMVEESPREAVNILSRLLIQNPNNSYLFANIGLAYEKLSNQNLAISNYKKAYELDKDNPSYSYNLAILYDQNKDYDNAIEMYAQTLKNAENSNSTISLEEIQKRIEIIREII